MSQAPPPTSPLYRLLAGIRVVAGAGREIAAAARASECVNCHAHVEQPSLAERAKQSARGIPARKELLCDECAKKAADAGAGVLADLAEQGLSDALRGILKRR
jgi:hypothetical protein